LRIIIQNIDEQTELHEEKIEQARGELIKIHESEMILLNNIYEEENAKNNREDI
jgi:hypothetical protein